MGRTIGWIWALLLWGCASGESAAEGPPCGNRGPCPRGQACVAGQCTASADDLGVADRGAADARPIPVDAVVDAAAADAAADALAPDAQPVDAGPPPVDALVADAGPDAAHDCMPGTARDCGRNIGLCRAGRQTCGDDGRYGPCEGGVEPREDVCNGADDDCNGTIDDGFQVGMPCEGEGVCGAGVIECRTTVLTRCSTQPGGSMDESGEESCNDLDDDCDGSADEGLGVGEGCVGACGDGLLECDGEGGVVCSTDEGGSGYVAVGEICNGRDDDCDGRVDETFALGMACEGRGICGAGVRECDGLGSVRCSTERGGSADESRDELCNGMDDDCDGMPDDGLGLGGACMAPGICGAGVRECGRMGAVQCSTEPGASADGSAAEVCNRLDDDCDGSVDEGFNPGPEACNGLDDDCDGITDEGAACGGETCENAPPFALYSTVAGGTNGLADDYARSTCAGLSPGRDQVFRLSFPAAGDYAIGVAPLDAAYDPLYWIATACGAVDQCLTPSARSNSQGPGRPEARAIAVPRAGDFFLVVDSPVDQAGGGFVASAAPLAAGERCGTAIALPVPGRFVGTTAGRANDVFGNQCPAGWSPAGADQVFSVDLPAPRRLRIRVQPGADVDPVIQVVSDCADVNGTCAGGVNNRLIGGEEVLEVQLAAGVWYIVVDHVQAPGPFLLEVTPLP
ncbi:MAG: hypothetical protein H6706_11395 [Myxococcales bacterium]|nr:hypothetical protein [Myxococcales bacterium]